MNQMKAILKAGLFILNLMRYIKIFLREIHKRKAKLLRKILISISIINIL